MTTGQRIQQARKKAGLSQKQLGEKLGLSASMIGQWENDLRNPKYETLQKIAKALDVDPETFYTDREKEISEWSNIDGWQSGVGAGEKGLTEDLGYQGYTFSKLERDLIWAFSDLNESGQQEAVKRVEELTEIPRYRRQEPAQNRHQPRRGGTDTPAAQDAPEGPGNGE